MANAAAKKEAAAKKGATNLYFPLILSLNLIHLFLIYGLSSQSFTKMRIFITFIEWVGTYIAYQGILNDAEVGKLTRERSGAGSGSKGGDNNAPLAGGIYLDVLGLIVFVQYGSIFIGKFLDWLLIVAPAIYGLIKWMNKPSSESANNGNEEQDEGMKKNLEERRRKRAERRRQKRA